MKNATRSLREKYQKEFAKIFFSMTGKHSPWEIWQDFIYLAAIEISNVVDLDNKPERTKTYQMLMKKYTEADQKAFAELFNAVVMGMERSQNHDFLGELYMMLNLGNAKAGQFFTPYDLCAAMARVSSGNLKSQIEEQHWVSVYDPACGAGATLLAFAEECMCLGINYQTSVLFVAQDVDYVVGLMCYIQLSLRGCPGYVVIANTLTTPEICVDQRGLIPIHGDNVWYTPFYFRQEWHFRRLWAQMDMLFRPITPQKGERESLQAASETGDNPTPTRGKRRVKAATAPPMKESMNETKTGQLTLF